MQVLRAGLWGLVLGGSVAHAQDAVLVLDVAGLPPEAAWGFVPFTVPPGTAELELRRLDATPGVVVDLGLVEPGGRLRGWSGGNPEPIVVGAAAASRSYRAGPLEPGEWEVAVGFPGKPSGALRVELGLWLREAPSLAAEPERGDWAAPAALRAGPGWFAGDFHVHSSQSGDARVEADLDAVVAAARAAGLDFVALSEHNTDAHLQLLGAAQARHPDVLLLPAVEWTTHDGHALAPGATAAVPPWVGARGQDAPGAAAAFRAQGAAFAPAHPTLALGDACLGCAWEHALGPEAIDALEVATLDVDRVGTLLFDGAVAEWDALCATGRHVAAIGGSDDHTAGLGTGPLSSPVGRPRTWVEAPELSVAGVLAGLRAGRTVVQLGGAGDPWLELDAPGRVGDTVTAASAAVVARVEGGAGATLEWWVDGALAGQAAVDTSPWEGRWALDAPAAGERRVRALLRVGGQPRVLTSHLWLRAAAAADTGGDAGGGGAKGCGCAAGGAGPGGLAAALGALALAWGRRRARAPSPSGEAGRCGAQPRPRC
jgi:MYXO-CTERM domain-containing protein